MSAFPLEIALLSPLAALAISAALPFVTARILAMLFLRDLPLDGEARAYRLLPFRRGAMIVGFAQVMACHELGNGALGPLFAASPYDARSATFGFLTAIVAFLAGGIARRVEEPKDQRSTVKGVVLLRLRLLAWLSGPILASLVVARIPVEAEGGGFSIPHVLLAIAIAFVATGYGGLLLARATYALTPASPRVRELAERAASGEGVRLFAVMRLPTSGTYLANAAAVPWARTMIVTDAIADLLDDRELLGVLAHEAAHLSEKPVVGLTRLSVVAVAVFVANVLLRNVSEAWALETTLGFLVAILVALYLVQKLARKMEERADARACASVGPEGLASALRKIHAHAQMPMVTGKKRVHPDLYDRLTALGEDLGPRPAPPPRTKARFAILPLAALLFFSPYLVRAAFDVAPGDVQTEDADAARIALVAGPWDAEAMIALAWSARRDDRLGVAESRLALANLMDLEDEGELRMARAELLAARGRCDAARAEFEAALRDRAAEAILQGRPLELREGSAPPTLQTRCD